MRPVYLLRFTLVLTLLAISPVQAQIQRIASADTTAGNHFGAAVAYDGERLLLGASGEASCGENAGAAYIYERRADGRYTNAARLVASECAAERFFGHAVALSGDLALIAASRAFHGDTTPNPVLLFERQADGRWAETAQLLPGSPDAIIGFGVAVALDGEQALVGAEGDPESGRPGSVFVYERDGQGTWRQTARIGAPGRFGAGLVLEGNQLAVTAPPAREGRPDGAVFVYERDAAGTWQAKGRIDGFRDVRLAVAFDGDRMLVGRANAGPRQRGAAEIYAWQGERWVRTATLEPLTAYDFGAFGTAVALSGDRALVAGYTEQLSLPYNIDRVVYVFGSEGTSTWRQRTVIDIGSTAFGVALDLDGRTALIGEAGDEEPGAAYIVRLF
ncbi:MAG: hypothetical protein HKN04_00065 [Rhodothermaceae bacterium]|nr:hypothetical protein [Rhodothermaceae bacterium]